jgi:hypothetical protein
LIILRIQGKIQSFIALLLPEIIEQYSVVSIQWSVKSGKWEAIEIMAAIDICHDRQYSPTNNKIKKNSSRASQPQRLQLYNNLCHRACQPKRPQHYNNFCLPIQILLAGPFLGRLLPLLKQR